MKDKRAVGVPAEFFLSLPPRVAVADRLFVAIDSVLLVVMPIAVFVVGGLGVVGPVAGQVVAK